MNKKSLLTAIASIAVASIASTAFASTTASQKLENVKGFRPAWALDRIDQRQATLDDIYNYSLTGAGVSVYVVDSGINATHEDFSGRVAAGFSSIRDSFGTGDCNGHGTHSAGIIGGNKYGVAKGVTLIPVRVLNCSAGGSSSFIYPAINWIIEHHQPGVPAIVNLSVGMSRSVAFNDAIRALIADGLIVIGAAGNQNRDACGFSPASEPSVIAVGAIDRNNSRASYSNFGSCVDIFAPGSDMVAAWKDNTSYRSSSGTSNAAPIVSGIAALMLQENPALTQQDVLSRLVVNATNGVIANVGTASPNLLAFSNPAPVAVPVTTTVAPTTTVIPTTTVVTTTTIAPTTTVAVVAPTTTVAPTTSVATAVNLSCTTAGARVTIDKTSYVCVNVGNALMLVPKSY